MLSTFHDSAHTYYLFNFCSTFVHGSCVTLSIARLLSFGKVLMTLRQYIFQGSNEDFLQHFPHHVFPWAFNNVLSIFFSILVRTHVFICMFICTYLHGTRVTLSIASCCCCCCCCCSRLLLPRASFSGSPTFLQPTQEFYLVRICICMCNFIYILSTLFYLLVLYLYPSFSGLATYLRHT